jgi:hypothetical protein
LQNWRNDMKRVMLLLVLAGMVAVLAPVEAYAAPEDLAVIEKNCPTRFKMSAADCKCVRDNAAKLTDGQQKYVAAIMVKDKAAKKKAAKAMPAAELTHVENLLKSKKAPCQM